MQLPDSPKSRPVDSTELGWLAEGPERAEQDLVAEGGGGGRIAGQEVSVDLSARLAWVGHRRPGEGPSKPAWR